MTKQNILRVITLFFIIGICIYFIQKDDSSTLNEGYKDFAIEDATQRVQKIFMSSKNGETILLERPEDGGNWDLNKTYKARPESVELILEAIEKIGVYSPVPKRAFEPTMKLLAVSHVKVEIYTEDGDTPEKIWYVGEPTMNNFGTVMLLELPGKGRSDYPYVTHILGFKGFLKARFFTDLFEWRYTEVFEYPDLGFKHVEMVYPQNPEDGFSVEKKENSELVLFDENGETITEFDTAVVQDFVLGFKFVHFEAVEDGMEPAFRDSVFQSTPLAIITVTENDGSENSITLFPIKQNPINDAGVERGEWNPDQMYGKYKGEFVHCQYYAFNKILYRQKEFR